MLILLPPSEGKTPPVRGLPLDLSKLAFSPELDGPRERLVGALEKLAGRPRDKAVAVMGFSPGQAGEIELNARLGSAPTAPAREVYSGVLYERLGLAGPGSRAGKRAERHVLVTSGLWGMLRPGDPIPYYRLSMKPKLTRVGGLAAFWRKPLAAAMAGSGFDEPGKLVLDLRSGAYASVWKPRHADLLAVRGFTETGGRRKAISHMAKAIRGDVARLVLGASRMPDDAEGVADLLSAAGLRVELGARTIDVIEDG